MSFAKAKIVATWADPRRLAVNLTSNSFAVTFVVLHAPCRSATTTREQVQAWWDETSDILRKASVSNLTWLLADANAPLATKATQHYWIVGGGGVQ